MSNRAFVGLGAAGTVLAVEVIQPSEIVTIPLLAVSLFFIAWGVAPHEIRRVVDQCGVFAPRIHAGLNWLDRQVSALSEDKNERRECLNRLGNLLEGGLKILNRRVGSEEEFTTWNADNNKWIDDVFAEIDTHFSSPQAITFRSVVSVMAAEMPPCFNREHNKLKLHHKKRIENLRRFLDTQSSKL